LFLVVRVLCKLLGGKAWAESPPEGHDIDAHNTRGNENGNGHGNVLLSRLFTFHFCLTNARPISQSVDFKCICNTTGSSFLAEMYFPVGGADLDVVGGGDGFSSVKADNRDADFNAADFFVTADVGVNASVLSAGPRLQRIR
jgi:hypothetical protein